MDSITTKAGVTVLIVEEAEREVLKKALEKAKTGTDEAEAATIDQAVRFLSRMMGKA